MKYKGQETDVLELKESAEHPAQSKSLYFELRFEKESSNWFVIVIIECGLHKAGNVD